MLCLQRNHKKDISFFFSVATISVSNLKYCVSLENQHFMHYVASTPILLKSFGYLGGTR